MISGGVPMENYLFNLNFINPVVRKVGIQENEWRRKRKIYDYEIMFCVSGHAKLSIEDKAIELIENTFVLIMPNKAHTFQLIDKNSEIYWVHFDFFQFLDVSDLDKYLSSHNEDLYLDNLIKTKYIRPSIPQLEGAFASVVFNKMDAVKIIAYLNRIKTLYESDSLMWQLEAKSYILLILVQYFNKINIMDESKNSVSSEFVYSAVSSYIIQNIHKKLTLEEVTKNIPYCHDYANKLFKKSSGISINEYINKVKLRSAKELFIANELSVNDIAHSLGFSTQHYFSRFIKKYTGLTPSQLRKQLIQ